GCRSCIVASLPEELKKIRQQLMDKHKSKQKSIWFKRCKSSLLEELSAHQVDGVLKLDHSRAASKKLTISHAAGYICCLIDGHNIIHNIVVTGTTSYRELAGCFQELKPRINLGDGPLTVFTDNACCGNPSQTLRATIEANC
ncbi:hypothetical protein FOZ62_005757, partial [Perkinsus olseni]